uniref:Tail collar protein n=1 Tax=Dulem virus 29 TaxID=3145747 RepID=A0AAU8AWP3_9CAUD
MAIDQVKTINELERLPQLLGNYAAAISTGAATGSATIDQIREYVRQTLDNDFFQTGMMIPYGGNNAPQGWLKCDGSAISRETYADLFAVIGTKYGSGDGSTTFNIPNLTSPVFSGTLPVVGNGKALGIFDGERHLGLKGGAGYGISLGSGTNCYNVNVGLNIGGSIGGRENFSAGLTTQEGNSGVIVNLKNTNISMIIKY